MQKEMILSFPSEKEYGSMLTMKMVEAAVMDDDIGDE